MNNVILKGRLTRDVELKYTQSADPIAFATFSVAVNRMKQGECDFINCKAWGKTAEFLEKYFKKGQEILLQGRIEVSVVDTDGIKKTFTNVVAEKIEFCGSKADATEGNEQTVANTSNVDDTEEDLPF